MNAIVISLFTVAKGCIRSLFKRFGCLLNIIATESGGTVAMVFRDAFKRVSSVTLET